jgi:hypothetical protein
MGDGSLVGTKVIMVIMTQRAVLASSGTTLATDLFRLIFSYYKNAKRCIRDHKAVDEYRRD